MIILENLHEPKAQREVLRDGDNTFVGKNMYFCTLDVSEEMLEICHHVVCQQGT